jgi:serine/threonine protein kinase
LNDSQNLTEEFLKEVSNYKLVDGDSFYGSIVPCYGISQDPVTKDYLMVMQYIPEGDLRKYLSDNQVSFKDRLRQLYWVADGLSVIHRMGLVHRDFHSGNILNRKFNDDVVCFITDLGLCRSANEKDKDKVYGVLPYLAPEVLNRKPYTQASDVYSFGMIAYEILTGLPPYYDMPHNEPLALYICEGLRPNIDELKIPQLLKNLIKKC